MPVPGMMARAQIVGQIYAAAEQSLLASIARRIANGIDRPGWEAARLADLLAVRAEFEAEIARAARAGAREVAGGIADAYRADSSAIVGEISRARGPSVAGVVGQGGNRAAIRALATEAVTLVGSTHPRMLRAAFDIYRAVTVETAGAVLTGGVTRRTAAQLALNRYANAGITGFVDAAGRQWEAATYAEMSTRSAVLNASRAARLDALTAIGEDQAIVSTSPRPCPLCGPWEGVVVSTRGNTPGIPTLAEARDAGLFHPNCTHTIGLYVPGLTRPVVVKETPAEQARRYEDSQIQRYNERAIRQWKRREAVAITPEARADARAHVSAWQARQRAHVEAHGLRRKYEREQNVRAR